MKYIRKFNENSLEERSVLEWCELFMLQGYYIHDDGVVDCDNGVYLYSNYKYKKMPIQFGVVKYDFTIIDNKITNLEGSPKEVGGHFNCRNNKLVSLFGGPKKVKYDFFCEDNKLRSIEYSPEVLVEGSMFCEYNPIYEVYKLFPNYKSYQDSLDYNYWRVDKIIKHRFKEALEEIDVDLPESIRGYKYI